MNYQRFFNYLSPIANNLQHIPQQLLEFIALFLVFMAIFIFYNKLSKLIIAAVNGIHHEIKDSVQSKFIDLSQSTNDLIDVAVEIWRMKQRIAKVAELIPENNKKSLENSIQKLYRYLEKNDIELLDYTGQPYNQSLSSIDIVSSEKGKNLIRDTIVEMIEPGILIKGKLVQKGKAIVATKK